MSKTLSIYTGMSQRHPHFIEVDSDVDQVDWSKLAEEGSGRPAEGSLLWDHLVSIGVDPNTTFVDVLGVHDE